MWVINKLFSWLSKINFLKLAVYIFVSIVVTSTVISETFAKYKSKYISVDYAAAAAWTFEVQDVDIAEVDTFTVDVFNSSTILEDNLSAIDTHAKNSGTRNSATVPLIAPGTAGYFDLKLENLSDVNVLCTVTVEEVFSGAAGIEFKYKFAADEEFSYNNVKELHMNHSTNQTLRVYWQWPFSNDDSTNDNLVRNGTIPCTVTVTVSAKQLAE